MIDGTAITTYVYDNAGALTNTTHGTTTFSYAYDRAGNLTTVAGPNGTTTTGYNEDNLPVTMKRGTQNPTTYDYDPAGLLKTVTLPNHTTTSYTRDPLGQVTSQEHALPTGTLATRDYTYDTAGNPTSLTTTRGTATTNRTWAYDAADRLTAECTGTTPCVPAAANLGWTYDKAGNILTDRDGTKTTSYTDDPAGQTLTAADGTKTLRYTYDGDGNLTADGKRTYAYDLAGRTTSVTTGAKTTAYTYDGDGNRDSATTGSAVTGYAWDINSALPTLVKETTGATSQEIGRAVQQECRDRYRMPSSA
jgi:RHS Repeat.